MSITSPHPAMWPAFMKLAAEAINASQPTTYRRFVSLMLKPSFDDELLLQLQWEKDGLITWYRTTWHKHEDSFKFHNIMERLKYIGKSVVPTLTVESGILKIEDTEILLNLLRNLHVSPYIDNDGYVVLDGCMHTLTFGTDYSTHCSFHWNYMPEEYKDLQKVADLLDELCQPIPHQE